MPRPVSAAVLSLTAFVGCGAQEVANVPESDATAAAAASDDAGASGPLSESASSDTLSIGSMAPSLEVAHWFPTEMENAEPITGFASGKVHVVEFWATWCGPCVASIPHIKGLQETYGEEDVTFISLTDEDVETVESFFERDVRGYDGDAEEPPTYRDYMTTYRVGSDPDGSASQDYMEASGQQGIPAAFIVGKTGQVEWIGHPMAMDEILASVVNDTWDREAYEKEFRAKQERELAIRAISRPLQRGDFEAAEAMLDELAAGSDDPQLLATLERFRGFIKINRFFKQVGDDPEAAADALPTVVTEASAGDPQVLNQFTWQIFQMASAGDIDSPRLLQAAADVTEEALSEDQPQASMLDTIAHLYAAKGDVDKAIDFQRRAVTAGEAEDEPEMQQQLEAYLEELLAEKEPAAESE